MLSSEANPEGATALCAVDFNQKGREKTDILNDNILFRASCEGATLPHNLPKGIIVRSSAVNNKLIPVLILLRFSCRPFVTSLCPSARFDLLHPLLWCGGWQALFDYSGGLGV